MATADLDKLDGELMVSLYTVLAWTTQNSLPNTHPGTERWCRKYLGRDKVRQQIPWWSRDSTKLDYIAERQWRSPLGGSHPPRISSKQSRLYPPPNRTNMQLNDLAEALKERISKSKVKLVDPTTRINWLFPVWLPRSSRVLNRGMKKPNLIVAGVV